MANETTLKASLEPTIYFYVNKATEQVEYVSMYTIFGITVRPKGEKWAMGTRDDLEKFYSSEYEIWSYEGSPDDDEMFDGSWDPEDGDSWEVPPVQTWAKGEDISKEDIAKYARLVNDGDYITAEEAEAIPGEDD